MAFSHQIDNESLGKYGSRIITTAAVAVPGTFGAIVSLDSATSFTTLTGNCAGYGSNTFPAGMVLYGTFTSITLAAGKVIAYYDRTQ